jgi:hypothetical protein
MEATLNNFLATSQVEIQSQKEDKASKLLGFDDSTSRNNSRGQQRRRSTTQSKLLERPKSGKSLKELLSPPTIRSPVLSPEASPRRRSRSHTQHSLPLFKPPEVAKAPEMESLTIPASEEALIALRPVLGELNVCVCRASSIFDPFFF